jgi:hypothetical protein
MGAERYGARGREKKSSRVIARGDEFERHLAGSVARRDPAAPWHRPVPEESDSIEQ